MPTIKALRLPTLLVPILALLGALVPARAELPAPATATLTVRQADRAAAARVANLHEHVMRPQPAGQPAATAAHPPARLPPASVQGWYPADLTYRSGPVVTSAAFNNVYVDCAASCWGTPATFQQHLATSTFLHITDQYTGQTTSGRYTVGSAGTLTYNFFGNTLYYSDILAIVHAGAVKFGSGYSHIINVFLPQGMNTCDSSGACYEGTTPAQFCAYHASVDFTDVGHVLYTVEPYQDVPGCVVGTSSPNGLLIDSTSSTLLHETFETITDPDDGTGWYAQDAAVNGEVGDLCGGAWFVSSFSGKSYQVQDMYSNAYHACVNGP